jgi:hypothetical protein
MAMSLLIVMVRMLFRLSAEKRSGEKEIQSQKVKFRSEKENALDRPRGFQQLPLSLP